MSNSAYPSIALSPNQAFIVDYHGKLYSVEQQDLFHISNVGNLPSKLIPKKEWKNIISKGTQYKANRLLTKLASYLPKDDLWQYIEEGLLRNDGLEYNRVADTAYEMWSSFVSLDKLTDIRINPKYRKNLSVLANWKDIFSEHTSWKNVLNEHNSQTTIESLDEAVGELSKYSMEFTDLMYQEVSSLRIYIASSQDVSKLKRLMHHENHHIALASWYALSKLVPNEVAYEILNDSIQRTDSFEYNYSMGGCIGFSEQLSTGHAAYDLFSDYLSNEQLIEIISQDLALNKSYSKILVRSKKLALALQMVAQDDPAFFKNILQDWNLRETLINSTADDLKDILQKKPYKVINLVNNQSELFSDNLIISIKELYKNDVSFDYKSWVITIFKFHNDNAKELLDLFLNFESSKINQDELIHRLYFELK